jgi:opacity protein-like surface antigen
VKQVSILGAVAAIACAVAASLASASAPVPCAGTVVITGTSNFEVRTAGKQTFTEFDFTGLHDICLASGSKVNASIAGHLVQRASADGDLGIRIAETLSYGGGTLGFRGEASLSNGKWQSHIQSVGAGTGPLAGMHGQGTFWPTGPNSFDDVIYYIYAP